MSENIVPFSYGDKAVRTLMIDGEPWFVLADLCAVLDIANPRNVAARLDDDEKGVRLVDTLGGPQNVTVVNEPGMYQVVLRSDKPEAKQFRWWITHEVLPTIRKTGSFGGQVALTDEQIVAQALQITTRRVEALEAKVAEDAPKVDAYDAFMDADGTYSVGNVAKMLGLSQNKLFDSLRNCGVMIAKGAMRNTPYQQYMHHFTVKAYEFERSDGTRGTSYTTRVQPSGVDFIRRKLGMTAVAA